MSPPEIEDRPPENRKPISSLSGHHSTPTNTESSEWREWPQARHVDLGLTDDDLAGAGE